jgi:DNA-directed RNA polymerase specialized sigma24 family protein
MSFLKDVSPTGAAYDLIAYLRQERQYNWLFWIAASLPPMIMVYTFQSDAAEKSTPPPPEVIFAESWPATRTREESIKAITARQAEKDAFAEKKRQSYEKLGRMMGMDVEEIKREAARVRAEARAAAEKAGDDVRAGKSPETPAPVPAAPAAR